MKILEAIIEEYGNAREFDDIDKQSKARYKLLNHISHLVQMSERNQLNQDIIIITDMLNDRGEEEKFVKFVVSELSK